LSEFADLARKAKQFEAWQDDIAGERRRCGCFSRRLWSIDVTLILSDDAIACFRCIPVLPCDYSHVTWISLCFEIFFSSKILGLSCGFEVAPHFLLA
jgi:hypothetical protein